MCVLRWRGNSLVAAHRCLPIMHVRITSHEIMQAACVVNSFLQICGSITKLVKIQYCGYSVRKSFKQKKQKKKSKMWVFTWQGNSLVAAHRCLPIMHVRITSHGIMQAACVVNSL